MAYLLTHDTQYGPLMDWTASVATSTSGSVKLVLAQTGPSRARGFRHHADPASENATGAGAECATSFAIETLSERNPLHIPWRRLGVECVLETCGVFISVDQCMAHMQAGAKKVVLSTPSPDAPLIVCGVNDEAAKQGKYDVVSAGSGQIVCLAILVKVLKENFGVVEGLASAVQSASSSTRSVDGVAGKDLRSGRGANNIIPTPNAAAKIIARIFPELEGSIASISYHVPTWGASLLDFNVKTEKPVAYEDIKRAFRTAAESELQPFLACAEEPIVSSDVAFDSRSCIFDADAGFSLNKNFFKLVSWYNETAFSVRCLDLIALMHHSCTTAPKKL
eukprot:TRINITY_DN7977_c0_g1_i2.p1 TRINITY_DN7977_c0_g1~~TRINITY_DN7977_c0_g1_i2.p1  ORF type:complete len:384 (+),score=90.84 TRINITY_DN7977_c0_g1_i2:145-1152(+)